MIFMVLMHNYSKYAAKLHIFFELHNNYVKKQV